jgi:2-succinyl-5-enolpyruvyl-6-hydroxy-3-cyclohexene-1-carboxylate synthase
MREQSVGKQRQPTKAQPQDARASDAAETGCLNLRWCFALLDGLATAGLDLLVLSPGSRSTPMVLAAQRHLGLDIVPILDERSAAFFALGAARASGRPAALLATSGSAPAHWYPAVIEASEAGVPLILLSADRPPRMRNWGANQTIDQIRLFGAFVRESHDPGLPRQQAAAIKAVRALGLRAGSISLGPSPGPVHINLPFDEPLVPMGDCQTDARSPVPTGAQATADHPAFGLAIEARSGGAIGLTRSRPAVQLPAGLGLIVCGPGRFNAGFAQALRRCAERQGLPVLADPLSGLRFGPESGPMVSGYDALLRNPHIAAELRPDWLLRFGHAPVSKRLGQWLEAIPTILVDPAGGWSDPNHDVIQRLCVDPETLLETLADAETSRDATWRGRWLAVDRQVQAFADRFLADAHWCEGHMIRTLIGRIPAGEALLCANSMPIRQLDTWSGNRLSPLGLFGNRGVSGIDGQVSTLAGLNHSGVPTWALLGDLSLCHDLSGLLQARRLKRPILVINNGGGRIFDYLPQHGLPDFQALWRTPVDIDLGQLAASVGLEHARVDTATALDRVLSKAMQSADLPVLIEVLIDGDRSRETHQRFWMRVAQASSLGETA